MILISVMSFLGAGKRRILHNPLNDRWLIILANWSMKEHNPLNDHQLIILTNWNMKENLA
jgi:hypothetical protein